MTEYESNDLEAENYEEDEQVNENNNKKEVYNNTTSKNENNNNENENEEEEEQENENESENNNNESENNNNESKTNKSKNKKIKNTKSQYTENTVSQNNNNTITKKTEENNEENEENPEILYEEFFNYFLPNKRNTLSIKECKNAMRCLGLVVTEREIQTILEIKVKTGKEKINLEEFKYVCNKKLAYSGNNIPELEEAFEMMDPEKTDRKSVV